MSYQYIHMDTTGTCTKMKPWCYTLLTLVTLLGVIFLGSASYYLFKKSQWVGMPETRDTFNVSGHGEIIGIPDVAIVTIGLETTKPRVQDAQKENTEKMNAFLKKAEVLGVAERDRKTTQYTVYPKYEYRTEGMESKSELVGYTVMNNAELKIRDFDKIPAILSLVGEFGLNQVGGLAFDFDDPAELRQQALEKALTDAQKKAQRIADITGIHKGNLTSFSEKSEPSFSPEFMTVRADSMGAGGPSPEPKVERGSQTIVIDIQASYEILP
jgi:uncharacterized protein